MLLLISGIFLGCSLLAVYLGYFLYMKRFSKNGASWNKKQIYPNISLIIATYNEEATLPSKLKNVLELNYPKELLELVLIDSGSTDRTSEIISDFVQKNPDRKVVFIKEKERLGKSHALNLAYPKAKGEIKIISDSDALLENNALNEIVSNFNDQSVGAACGRQILLNSDENPSTRSEKSYRNIFEVLRVGESVIDSTPIFHGELSAYRANLIGRLPENKSGDDSRQANVIRKKGFRSVYDKDAIFYEYAPTSFDSRVVQKVRRGQGLIRLFWDFKDVMFRKKYGSYGMFILPTEFFFHCIFPTLWILSFIMILVGTFFYSGIYFTFLIVVLAIIYVLIRIDSDRLVQKRFVGITSLFSSFLSSQLFLFYGLILWISGHSLHKWKKVEDVRNKYPEKKV